MKATERSCFPLATRAAGSLLPESAPRRLPATAGKSRGSHFASFRKTQLLMKESNELQRSKNKGGRPRDPRITELEQKLNVTRRRAAQILKSGESSEEIRQLRARKLNLECERIEFELEKARTSLEWIPIERFNEAIESFVVCARMAFTVHANEKCEKLASISDPYEINETLKRVFESAFAHGCVGFMGDREQQTPASSRTFANRFNPSSTSPTRKSPSGSQIPRIMKQTKSNKPVTKPQLSPLLEGIIAGEECFRFCANSRSVLCRSMKVHHAGES
jgi:hypothetical protein